MQARLTPRPRATLAAGASSPPVSSAPPTPHPATATPTATARATAARSTRVGEGIDNGDGTTTATIYRGKRELGTTAARSRWATRSTASLSFTGTIVFTNATAR